jgi:hypothetical protein
MLAEKEAPQADGHREDHVDVRDREKVRELGLGPQTLVETPAAWTVPVATRVEGVVLGSTAIADRAVATQPAGAASHDVSGGLALLVIEMQTAHVSAKDARDTEPLLAAGHVTAWASRPSGSQAGF